MSSPDKAHALSAPGVYARDRSRRVFAFCAALLLCLAGLAPIASAASYTWDQGGGSNRWDRANNWNPNAVPVAGDTADITDPLTGQYNVVVRNASQACANLIVRTNMSLRVIRAGPANLTVSGNVTVENGAVLGVGNGNPNVLLIGGNYDNNGQFAYNVNGGGDSGTVRFTGAACAVDADGSGNTGTGAFWNLDITGTATLQSNVTVDNDLTVSGTLNLNGYTLTVNGNTTVNGGGILNVQGGIFTSVGNINTTGGTLNNNTGTVNLGGTFTIGTYNKGTGTFNWNGTSQAVTVANYYVLKISGTGTTLAGSFTGTNTIDSKLQVASGADLSLAALTMTFGNGATLQVDSGGTLNSSGATVEAGVGNTFAFTVNGTLDVDGLTINRPDANGLTINNGAILPHLDNVTYQNGADTVGSRYLYVGHTGGGFVFDTHTFPAMTNRNNVKAPNGVLITMVDGAGAGAGEANDGSIDGNITWKTTKTWDGSANTNWNNGANWSGGTAPVADDVVYIPAGMPNEPTVNVNSACAKIDVQGYLTIAAGITLDVGGDVTILNTGGGGTIDMNANGSILRIGGYWSHSMTGAGAFNEGNGTVIYDSTTADQTLPYETWNNLTVEKGSKTLTSIEAAALDVSGNFVITSGTVKTGAFAHTVDGTTDIYGKLVVDNGGTFNFTGAAIVKAGGTLELNDNATVGIQTSLTIDDGVTDGKFVATDQAATPTVTWFGATRYAFTVDGEIDVTGMNFDHPNVNGLTISEGATVTRLESVAFTNGLGTGTYLRIMDQGTATYSFGGHSFDANLLYNVHAEAGSNVTINMAGATGAGAGEANDDDPDGDTHINWYAETLWDGSANNQWVNAANWTPAAVPTTANAVRVTAAANLCRVNTAVAVCNSIIITGGETLRINADTFNLTVSDSLTIEATGIVSLLFDGDLTVGGNWTNDGSFSASPGLVVFNGNTLVDKNSSGVGTETFDDLTVSGTMTIKDNDSVTVGGAFNPSGGTINAGDGTTFTTTGSWSALPSTFNRETSTVKLQGTANVPNVTYYNLTIDGTCTLTTDITVKNNLVINTSKSLNLGTYTLTVEGDITNHGTLNLGTTGTLVVKDQFTNTGTFTSGSGTKTSFQGTTQTIPALTYDTLEIAGSSATLGGAITINNLLDIDSGTLDIGANTVTFDNGTSLLVDGTFEADGGTLTSAAAEYYGITINGTVNVASLTVTRPNDNGITINNTATVSRLDNVTISGGQNAGASARYLYVGHSSGTFSFTGHTYSDTSFDWNVVAPNGATVSMVNAAGAGSGEANDGAIDSNITWVNSNTWDGSTDTSWNDGTNWSKGTTPVAGEVVIIPNVANDPTLDVNAACESVTVENGAVLTMSNANTLTVSGNVTVETGGTLTMSNASADLRVGGQWTINGTFTPTLGTVTFSSTASDQTIPATTFYSLEIDKSGKTAYTSGNLICAGGNLLITAGTLDPGNDVVTVTGTGTADVYGKLQMSGSGQANVGGAVAVKSGGEINLQGTATLYLGTSLTIEAGAPKGKLVTSGTPTIDKSAAARYSFTVAGEISVNGLNVNNPDANGLTINDAATITQLDSVDFNNGLVASGTYLRILETSTATYQFNQHDFDNNCQYNVYAASTNPSVTMVGASGAKAGATYENDPGTVITWTDQKVWDGSTSTSWNESTNWSDNAVPLATDSIYVPQTTNDCLVNINTAVANAVQIGAVGVLRVGNAGTNVLTVSDTVTIDTDGTLVLQNDATLNVAGNWTNNGTLTLNSGTTSGTVVFNGTSTLDNNSSGAGTETFDNLTVSGALTISDNDSVSVTGTFNPTGGTVNAGTSTTLTTIGNWTAVPSTFNRGTSTVVLQGTANVPNVTYYNLTIDGTCTLTSNITVMNDLVINSGDSLNLATYTLTVEGAVTNAGTLNLGTTGNLVLKDGMTNTGTFTSNSGTKTTFSGTSQNVPALTYFNVEVAGSTATLAGNITVNGTLDVDSGTLDLSNKTVTFDNGADLLVDGTLNASGATLTSAVAEYYGITINGTVDVSSLTVTRPDDNGITINDTATVTKLDNVTISSGQDAGAGARYLYIGHNTGTFTFTGHTYDTSFDWSVMAPNGATVSMVNAAGAGAGEANDGAIDANITWVNSNTWDGSTSTSWNDGTNWSKGTTPVAGEVVIIPNVANDPTLNVNAACSQVTIENGAVLTMSNANTLTVSGNVTIESGGTLTISNASAELLVGASWSNSGTFTHTNGTVSFNSTTGNQTIPQETFYNLTIDKNGRTATTSGNLTITNDLTIAAGTLNLDNDTHSVAGTTDIFGTLQLVAGSTITSTGAMTVKSGGELNMQGACTLKLGASLTVDSGAPKGCLRTSGSTPTITWDSITRYSCTIAGQIDVNGLSFNYCDANGLTTNDGATITKLDSVDFNNGVLATGTYLRVLETNAVSYQLNQHDFDNNCQYNVEAVSTNPTITMIGATGAKSGEAYDNDPGTVITWTTQKVWDGSTSTSWNVGSNWSDSAVPIASSNIYIPETTNDCIVDINTAVTNTVQVGAVGYLRVGSAGTNVLTVSDAVTIDASGNLVLQNDATLNVAGNWTNDGTFTLNSGTTSGTVVLNGTTTLDKNSSGAGTETFDNLTVSGTLTIADNDSVSVTGTFNPTGGTVNAGTGTTLTTTGSWTAVPTTFNRGTSTVTLQGTANVPNVTYHNLTIDGACTLTSNITVKNDLVINNGDSLNLATYTLTVEGELTNNGTLNLGSTGNLVLKNGATNTGTFTSNSGTKTTYSGTTQNVLGLTYYNLEIAGPTATLADNITVNGTLDVDSGTLDLADKTVTFANGASLLVDGALKASGATLTSAVAEYYSITINGTVDVSSLTVTRPDDNGITINNTATVTRLDNVTFSGGEDAGASARYLYVDHAAGTFTFTGHTFSDTSFDWNVVAPNGASVSMVNAAGAGSGETYDGAIDANISWVNSNTWNGSTDTSWNDGTNWSKGTIPVAGEVVIIPNVANDPVLDTNASCESVTIENGAVLTLGNANTLTVAANVTIESGGTLIISNASAELQVGGGWSNSGTFTHTNGVVNFNSTSQAQSIPQETFYNLEVEKSTQTATLTGSTITVSNNLTITSGTLATSNKTLNISGTTSVTGTLQLDAGGSVTATGAATVNSGGSLTLTDTCTLALGASLTISSGGSFSATGSTPTVTWDGITRYGFTVSGTIDIDAMNLNYCNANGLTINDAGTITDIDNLDCNNGLGTTTYLRILETSANTYDFSNCDFDANCQYNVYAASTNPDINMIGATGAKSGAAYENDPGTVIDWLNQNVWDGELSNSWNTSGNWTDGAVPSTEDTYVQSATYVCNVDINTAACNSLEVDASGTLVIDGGTDLLTITDFFTIGSTGTFTQSNGELRVGGDWTSNNSFTATGGTVTFNGGSSQTLGGSTAPTFYNLSVTGSSTLTLNVDATVNHTLTIATGSKIIVPANRTLSLNTTSSIDGELALQAGSTLELANGVTLTATANGAFTSNGTSWVAGQYIKVESPSAGNNFTMTLSGDVSMDYVRFERLTTSGLTLASGSGKTVSADNVKMYNIAAGGTYLTISGSDWNQKIFDGWGFHDPGAVGTEISVRIETGSAVLFTNYITSGESLNWLYEDSTDEDRGDAGSSGAVNWSATAVMLSEYAAKRVGNDVHLSWATLTEDKNAGFRVYRWPVPAGAELRGILFRAQRPGPAWTCLTPKLIPGASGSVVRQAYTYVDTTAKPLQRYAYALVDVDLGGNGGCATQPLIVRASQGAQLALTADVSWCVGLGLSQLPPSAARLLVTRGLPTFTPPEAAVQAQLISGLWHDKPRSQATWNEKQGTRKRQRTSPADPLLADVSAWLDTLKASPWVQTLGDLAISLLPAAQSQALAQALAPSSTRAPKGPANGAGQPEAPSETPNQESPTDATPDNDDPVELALTPRFLTSAAAGKSDSASWRYAADESETVPMTREDGLASTPPRATDPPTRLTLRPRKIPLHVVGPMARIETDHAGLYRLDADTLLDLGFDPDKRFVLMERGATVPVWAMPTECGDMGDLCFYARKYETRYSGTNVYWLYQVNRRADKPATIHAPGKLTRLPTDYAAVGRYEEDAMYRMSLPMAIAGEDHWFCPVYLRGGRSLNLTVVCTAVQTAEPGTARVLLRSFATTSPSSHIKMAVNGVDVGEYAWDQGRRFLAEAAIPAGTLQEGENIITLTSFGDTPAPLEADFIDWAEISYRRRLVAVNDTAHVQVENGDGAHITGFSEACVLVADTTNEGLPRLVTRAAVNAEAETFTVAFQAQSGHTYSASTVSALKPVARIAAVDPPRDLAQVSCEYLIIHTDALADIAKQFAAYHEARGRTVEVFSLAEALDTGYWGLYDPEAIRRLAQRSGAHYLLLLGDMTYDYFGRYYDDLPHCIPAPFTVAQDWQLVTDYPYAAARSVDGIPQIAVGRIPARTADEAQAVLAKIQAVPGVRSHDMIVAADEEQAQFRASCEAAATQALGPVERVYVADLGIVAARAHLLAAWGAGARVVYYAGHGASQQWHKQNLFTTASVASLPEQAVPPLVVQLDCMSSSVHMHSASLADTLLLTPKRGGSAVVGSLGFSTPKAQSALGIEILRQLKVNQTTIGEAFRRGQAKVIQENGSPDVMSTFILLGDPASH